MSHIDCEFLKKKCNSLKDFSELCYWKWNDEIRQNSFQNKFDFFSDDMTKFTSRISYQVENKKHCRHLLLFAFNQSSKAAKIARDICAVFRQDAINGFRASRGKKFDLTTLLSGRVFQFKVDQSNQLIHKDPRRPYNFIIWSIFPVQCGSIEPADPQGSAPTLQLY